MDELPAGPHDFCLQLASGASGSSQQQEGILVSYCLRLDRSHRIPYAVNNTCNINVNTNALLPARALPTITTTRARQHTFHTHT